MNNPHTLSDGLGQLNYKRGLSFGEIIDVMLYDRQHRFFLTEDGRFMKMWKLDMFAGDVLSTPQKFAISDAFAYILNHYPEQSSGQYLRFTHNDIEPTLDDYLSTVDPNLPAFSKAILDAALARQRQGATRGFFDDVDSSTLANAAQDAVAGVENEAEKEELFHTIERNSRSGQFTLLSDHYLIFFFEPAWMNKRVVESFIRRIGCAIGLISADETYANAYDKELSTFLAHIETLEKAISTLGMDLQVVSAQAFINLLFRELNPNRYRDCGAPDYNPEITIRDHLTGNFDGINSAANKRIGEYAAFSPLETSNEGWKIDDMHYRVASMKLLPTQTHPGMVYDALSEVEGESWVVLNFFVPSQAKYRRQTQVRTASLVSREQTLAHIPLLRPDPIAIERERNDLLYVTNAINPEERNRSLAIQLSLHIIVKDRDVERARTRATDLGHLMWRQGYYERDRADAIIHHCLPGNFRRHAMKLIQRHKESLTSNVADLLPVYIGYNGVKSPNVLVNNTNGTPCFIDVFGDHVVAGHSLIVGATGSGKSFLFVSILAQMQAKDRPKVFLIDRGGSYEALTQSLGGSYINLVLDADDMIQPTCLNPFYVPAGAEIKLIELEFMVNIVKAMMKSGTANEQGVTDSVSKEESNLIMLAIKTAFSNREKDQEIILSDIVYTLTQIAGREELGRKIADRLTEFTKEGVYGRLFDGPLSIQWESDLVVFETDKIGDSPACSVALLVLFFQIQSYVKFKLPLSRKKIIAIDEAHRALSSPHTAAQVDLFARECRKFKAALFLLSQSLNDFVSLVKASSSGGTQSGNGGILNNTKHFFLLSCSAQDYDIGRDLLRMTEQEISAWRRVSSLPPFYSECFYRCVRKDDTSYSGRFRLYSNPIALWMATSAPMDREARQYLTQKFFRTLGDLGAARQRAIIELAKLLPYGSTYKRKKSAGAAPTMNEIKQRIDKSGAGEENEKKPKAPDQQDKRTTQLAHNSNGARK